MIKTTLITIVITLITTGCGRDQRYYDHSHYNNDYIRYNDDRYYELYRQSLDNYNRSIEADQNRLYNQPRSTQFRWKCAPDLSSSFD